MEYKKIISNCDDDLYQKIVLASQKDQRTISSFVRSACEEKANSILKQGESN